MNKGKPVMDLMGEIQKTIAAGQGESKPCETWPPSWKRRSNRLGEVAMHMGATAMSPKVLNAFAFAYPFMEVTGDVVMAWMLLWRAVIAAQKLERGQEERCRLLRRAGEMPNFLLPSCRLPSAK